MRQRSSYGWLELIIGILLSALGIYSFFRPVDYLTTLIVVYGVAAFVTGIADIVFYCKMERHIGFAPTVSLVTGVLGVMAGLVLMVHPGAGRWAIGLFFPLWFIAHCISRLTHLSVVRFIAGTAFYVIELIVNILGILLGISMLLTPQVTFLSMNLVIGFYLLIQILSAAGMVTNSFAGQLVPICAYVVMAVSLNLTVGMLGELSLGHAGFMSVGAFAGTLVWVSLYDTTFPKPAALLLAFVVGGVVAGIFGFLVGIPVLRLSGDYLAIVTLAFGEIVKNFMNACNLGVDSKGLHFSLKDTASLNLDADGKVLINGAMGITGIKKASTFTIGIVLVIITLAVILNLVNSRAGRAITSIRDNEIAARSVGIPITKYKLMAFVTSAVFAGMAGVLYSLNYSSLVAKKFDYNTSILILVFVVLGGIGNGSVIAATVLTVLPELLRSMNDYRMLIYAIVLIVVMIFNQSPQMIAMRKRLTARFRKDAADKAPKKNKKEAA